MSERRYKRLEITPEFALLLNIGKYEIIARELPDDAKRVGAFYDEQRDCFVVVIESKTFEIVPDGKVIPPLDMQPTIRRLDE